MYASSSRNYPGPRVVIRAGDEETAPKKLIEKLADVNLIQCAIPIDHRVLVTHSTYPKKKNWDGLINFNCRFLNSVN
jgi:hypothetical protein